MIPKIMIIIGINSDEHRYTELIKAMPMERYLKIGKSDSNTSILRRLHTTPMPVHVSPILYCVKIPKLIC